MTGMTAGAVLDFRPERNGLKNEVKRLEKKVAAGSRFIVTQPVFDPDALLRFLDRVEKHEKTIPVVAGGGVR